MKNAALFTALLLLFTLKIFGQGNYWEKQDAPPGGQPLRVTQTTNGWLFATYKYSQYQYLHYISKNNGQNWEQFQLPEDTLYTQLVVGRTGRLFSYTPNQVNPPVYESLDGGETWSAFTIIDSLYSVGEDSQGRLYCLTRPKGGILNFQYLLRTGNGGASWDTLRQYSGGSANALEINAFDQIFVNVPVFNSYDYSRDAGQTWKSFAFWPFPELNRMIVSPQGTLLLPGDTYGIGRMAADSSTFQMIEVDTESPGGLPIEIERIAITPSGQLICSGNGYLYQSTDDGLSWQRMSNTTGRLSLLSAAVFTDGAWPVANFNTFQRTADWGQTLTAPEPIPLGLIENMITDSSGHWWAMTRSHLWESQNGGQSWEQRAATRSRFGFRKIMRYDPDRLLLSENDSLFFFQISTGLKINISPGNYGNLAPYYVQVNPANGYIFLPVFRSVPNPVINQTLLSMDEGLTWLLLDNTLTMLDMVWHPSGDLLATFEYGLSDLFLKKSTDGGLNWQPVPPPAGSPYNLFIDQQANIYTLGYKTADKGNTWTPAPAFYPDFAGDVANSLNHIYSNTNTNYRVSLSIDEGKTSQTLPPFDNVLPDNFSVYDLALDDQEKLLAPVGYGTIGLLFRSAHSTLEGAYLTGKVEKDTDGDCATYDPEYPLQNWIVTATGANTWYANTDSSGRYLMFVDTGAYTLNARSPLGVLWALCDSNQTAGVPNVSDTLVVDFTVRSLADCPFMSVDLALPALVRCFESSGTMLCCNRGTVVADSAWVDLLLDPALQLVSATASYDSAGSGRYRFPLGQVDVGECGSIGFTVLTDCDSTELGQTLCLSAHIFPDSLCIPVDNWSGAEVHVIARCESDTAAVFEVKNTRPVGSQLLEYIIIEDDVVLQQDHNTYGPGQSRIMTVDHPDGHFFRLESQQEPGHPFSTQVAAWLEGCGGLNSLGFTNQFFLDNGIPAEDVECLEVVGSYDPNDKQGFPYGVGNERFVKANTDLEYLIRFQNTGTAPAHFVVIRDTLSSLLDPGSLGLGAASHPYTWTLDGQGFLTIRFDNINLPDSFSNEAASHGFVSFRLAQRPGLPDGTVLFNRASIYFDYNGAVQTNRTRHTVGTDFLDVVSVTNGGMATPDALVVFPNPATGAATIVLKQEIPGKVSLLLTDVSGKMVLQKSVSGGQIELQRPELPPGMYIARLVQNGRVVAIGKIVWR